MTNNQNEKENKKKRNKPVIGITLGDYNGIGPEVIVKCLNDQRISRQAVIVIYGHSKIISYHKKMINADNFQFVQVDSVDTINHKRINVVNCWSDIVEVESGKPTTDSGKKAVIALKRCVEDAKSGKIDAIVTAPISKKNVQSQDFNFPGHTEFLKEFFEVRDNLMLLVAGKFKVGVVTGHIPLKKISKEVSKKVIRQKLKVLFRALTDEFGISRPKVAVLGLNPHAGEEGLLGDEEAELIEPAISEFKKETNHLAFGPFPADGFFGTAQFKNYDATLAMYHDQGLIPFKTLAFDSGVNYTAGLPVPRTSPDHGTAFSIAGKKIADPSSMKEAIYLAIDNSTRKENEMVELDDFEL